jgi:small-conductance mechanosensitive channel
MTIMARSFSFLRHVRTLAALAILAAPAAAQSTADVAGAPAMTVAPGVPAELSVWNRPITTLRATLGTTSPAERASAAAHRIQQIPDSELDETVRMVPARVGQLEGLMAYVGARNVFAILREDLDQESGETLESVGAAAERRLHEVLEARAAQRSLPVLLRGIGLSLVATLVFALVLWALVHVQRWLHRRITAATDRRAGEALRQVRDYLMEWARRAEQLVVWAIGLVAAYVWLTFVLSQFPYTQPWGTALGSRLRDVLADLALGAATATPGLLAVAIIFIAARFVVRLTHTLFEGVERGRLRLSWLQPETAEATRRISTLLIWLFAVTVAYPYIPGSQTPAFRGISVFVGLMLSLGSAGLVNQVMSGLVVVYARAIRPGEFVKIGDTEGIVSEVGLLSTKITTVRKEEVTIPNAVLVSTATTNYSRLADEQGAVVSTSVTIGYDAPWRQVEATLLLAAERTADVRKQPPPRVVQRALNDFYVEYMLLVHVDEPARRPVILSALHAQIQDAFNEYGVQIMSPHFMSQPDGAVVVPKGKWFAAPAKPES